ncbi:MAG: hypothetical protein EOM20_12595 [Spartobacteria bacterium]|nr:hypothetical protein [Spartobacteria bacterium]
MRQPARSLYRLQPARSLSRLQPARSLFRLQPARSLFRLQPAAHGEPHATPRARDSAKKRQKNSQNRPKMVIFTVFSPQMAHFWQFFLLFSLKSAFFGIFGTKHAPLAVRCRLKPEQRASSEQPPDGHEN